MRGILTRFWRRPKGNAFSIGGGPEIEQHFCLWHMAAVFRLSPAWRAELQDAAVNGNATAGAILERYPDAPLGRGESPKTVGAFTDDEMAVCVYAAKLRAQLRGNGSEALAGEIAALEQRINARIRVSSAPVTGASPAPAAPQSAVSPPKPSAASAPKPPSIAEQYAAIPASDHIARSRFFRAHKAEIEAYLKERAKAERAGPGPSGDAIAAAVEFAAIPENDHRARAKFCRENRAAVRDIINRG